MSRFCALLLLVFCGPALAQDSGAPYAPPPAIASRAYLLLDYTSGQTLAAQNPDERMEPASLTKLMTAYLTFAALRQKTLMLQQAVSVSARASKAEGSRMFIEPQKPVSVAELVRGMIVQSGNDACVALAEAIAGSEEAFAEAMNREAKRLGMNNTHFVNATGLGHPQHYTTARDLAILAAAIVRDFPEHYALYSMKDYRYNNITQSNRNRLLWLDPTVDGMKTGYTENAGYCLIASAKRGPRRLISVVLGTASDTTRATESQRLLNYGFQFYDAVRLYPANQPVASFRVWKGSINELNVGFPYDYYVSVPKGQAGKLKASVESQQPLLAPFKAGQPVGKLKLELDGKPFRETPVVALEDAHLAGIFGRGWDTIRLLFK
ncbi:MAG TPA: D-alanyl-D-alanine carboxypeptidase family protein [Burkholderiales bacterium]|nr:D-alanyl-D-alanine carboxypeptidase family protein [Burkholderiales bacterium]